MQSLPRLAVAALTVMAFASLVRAQSLPPPGGATQSRGDNPGAPSVNHPPVTGEQVYRQVCQACHMADARGGTGAATIPALANNPRLGAAAYPILTVVRGRGAMSGFTDLLSPAQIAGVVAYVRTHFGNNYPQPVTEAEVAHIEAAVPPR